MADIIAVKTIKGREYKQRFSELGWNALPKDKNGWTPIDNSQPATESTGVTQKPSTGQKIVNIAPKAEDEVKNEVKIDAKDAEVEEKKLTAAGEEKKAEFFKAIEGFNKGTIKDFFDEEKENIDPKNTEALDLANYSNKDDLQTLKDRLAKFFKYDVAALQQKFVG